MIDILLNAALFALVLLFAWSIAPGRKQLIACHQAESGR